MIKGMRRLRWGFFAAKKATGESRQRWFAYAPTLVLSVVLISAAALVDYFVPTAESIFFSPHVVHGSLGEEITLRTATLRVTRVRTAHVLVDYRGESKTTGTWLVVDLHLTPTQEPVTVSGIEVKGGEGALYSSSFVGHTDCGPAQTGVPTVCSVGIEMPRSALVGAHLIVPADGHRAAWGDDVALVDLGLDESSPAVTQEEKRILLHGARPEGGS